tara:strand:- start:367 stop:1314 length:948 start_codon:yes stop_codon:yes gene_type:complete
MVSKDANWHIQRRSSTLKNDPGIRCMFGSSKGSLGIVFILVMIQWFTWWIVKYIDSFILIGFAAWLNANTLLYSLTTFIHENSHGLVVGPEYRKFVACVIEAGLCSFGEQWDYTVLHYKMHHPNLNDKNTDPECPGSVHISHKHSDSFKKRILCSAIELIPGGSLLTQFGLSTVGKVETTYFKYVLCMISIVTLVCVNVLMGNKSTLFIFWTLTLSVSRWNISLHGQSIAEHKRLHSNDEVPTRSTIYYYQNLVGFNTGYHDEHHTFPNICWWLLPELRRRACKTFTFVQPDSYFKLWAHWAISGFDESAFRLCG